MRQWKDGETTLHYLYYNDYGRIVGEAMRAGHQVNTKHIATIYPNTTEIVNLGMYITSDYAKEAVERWWKQYDNTFHTNMIESRE